jgi:hypothetical protein
LYTGQPTELCPAQTLHNIDAQSVPIESVPITAVRCIFFNSFPRCQTVYLLRGALDDLQGIVVDE